MITTIIFDLDDTLYDELDYCKSGFKATAKFLTCLIPECGSTALVYDLFWRMFQMDRATTFDAALNELGIPLDRGLIRSLVRQYRRHTPILELPAESRKLLDELSQEYTLALLTDGYLPAQKLKVSALGIQPYFKHIVYTEQIGRQFWKPSPVGFEVIVAAAELPPQSMVYVGDNPLKDFIAPNRLGMKTIQVRRPHRLHTVEAKTPNAQAQYAIDTLGDLFNVLTKWNARAGKAASGFSSPPQ